ncbi:hypothetical protein HanRHA438_Chr01g0002881 [Helianthus annuus]|nr:hypothetical protein HanRHA438_Chr01g0002881 [Helianthus annuus]
MSAGGEVCNQSSRFKLLVGDFPATFQVAAKILLQNNLNKLETCKTLTTYQIDDLNQETCND